MKKNLTRWAAITLSALLLLSACGTVEQTEPADSEGEMQPRHRRAA